MQRIHLFEFEDQPWFPAFLRDGMTAYISWIQRVTGMLDPVMPRIRQVVDATQAHQVVDLCSGAGFPASVVADALASSGVAVVCSDLYPNHRALNDTAARAKGTLRVHPDPVDATAVPATLTGVRTLFNAFHHLPPPVARAVLEDAHDAGEGIVVVEVVDRRAANLVGLIGVPFAVAFSVPFLRPFRWSWLPFTYLVPALPLLGLWDGLVSCLRVYQPPELRALTQGLDRFHWQIERIPLPGAPIFATVLMGTPNTPSTTEEG